MEQTIESMYLWIEKILQSFSHLSKSIVPNFNQLTRLVHEFIIRSTFNDSRNFRSENFEKSNFPK